MTHTVLVVEDEPDILLVTSMALRFAGYETIGAASAEEALTVTERRHVDAILLDIRLPGMDGWEFLRWLRASGHHSRVPVIVTSAHDASALSTRSSEFGCAAYLTKPYRPADLMRELAAALETA